MITFIAFLFTIAGSINWLLIGLLQYDYIAGFFGFQAALMSRIFYVLFGIGAVYLVLRVIINKGNFKIWERKKKKQKEEEKSLEQEKEKTLARQQNQDFQPAYANIEASKEQFPQMETRMSSKENHAQFVDFGKLREFRSDSTQSTSDTNYENSPFGQDAASPSATENFFEPPQKQDQNETLFDEHMNAKK